MSSKTLPYLTKGITGGLHYLYSNVNRKLADKMFVEFVNPTNDRGNSIQVLKDLMAKINKEKFNFRVSSFIKTALTIKAFNSYFMCQDIEKLQHKPQDKFPRIIEMYL
jgi:hypothetical protein